MFKVLNDNIKYPLKARCKEFLVNNASLQLMTILFERQLNGYLGPIFPQKLFLHCIKMTFKGHI